MPDAIKLSVLCLKPKNPELAGQLVELTKVSPFDTSVRKKRRGSVDVALDVLDLIGAGGLMQNIQAQHINEKEGISVQGQPASKKQRGGGEDTESLHLLHGILACRRGQSDAPSGAT